MPRRQRDPDAYEGPIGSDIPPEEGEALHFDDPDAKAWYFVGRHLYQGRKHFQISKREAARRAGISESMWRQLEAGGRVVQGEVVVPNPRPENLYAAVVAVGEDPAVIFEDVQMQIPAGLDGRVFDRRLSAKLEKLNERDLAIVEQLVDSMLEQKSSGEGDA